jgi:hypothetical protein
MTKLLGLVLRIFVGYGGRQAQKVADSVHEYLRDLGFEVFMAPKDTGVGVWRTTINEALRRADVLLVVFTSKSSHSTELRRELALAKKWCIIPQTLLTNTMLNSDSRIPAFLRKADVVNFSRRNPRAAFEETARKLIKHGTNMPYPFIEGGMF